MSVQVTEGGGWKYSEDAYNYRWLSRVKRTTVTDANGCWVWQGFCHPSTSPRHLPYGQTSYRGKSVRVHRQMLIVTLGRPLQSGMHACHTCDNPRCVNPAHLFEATNRDNQRDMIAKKRHTKQKRTHCLRFGHPLSGDNLWIRKDGRRVCRECAREKIRREWRENRDYMRARQRFYRARRKLQSASE